MLPSDFRVRSLDGVADDWPITYDELLPYYERTDRHFGVSGLGGRPGLSAGGEDPPLPPLPIGAGGLKVARAHTRLGWHWWPEPNSILSAPYDGRRPCVQRGTCQQGCNEGAKASTDLTHWPKAIALGARLVTGARVRRIETERRRPRRPARPGSTATAASTSSRRRSWSWPPTGSARRGCCCCRPRRPIPTASPTRPASSAGG